MISLAKLLEKGVFDSYKVLTEETDLNLPISGVSILETPDFEKYIVDQTLILTTFYIIKKDTRLFRSLLKTLQEHKTPGIVIKLHRFIDEIPDSIIQEANKCGICIIGLDYDANLSSLYRRIYAEMQSMDYLERNYRSILSEVLTVIENDPSTRVLVEHKDPNDKIELLFYNYETEKITKSSDQMEDLFLKHQNSNEQFIKDKNTILFKDIVEYGGEPAYLYMIAANEENRNLLEMYAEVYHILVTFIVQKKKELLHQQDRFLNNFITNIASARTDQKDIVKESKIYNWDIVFPIFLILVSIREGTSNRPMTKIALTLKDTIIKNSGCNNNEIKFIFIDDDKILFIANEKGKDVSYSAAAVKSVLEEIDNGIVYIVSYAGKIATAESIPSRYRSLMDANTYLLQNNVSSQIVPPALIELIRLMKGFNSKELNVLLTEQIRPLIEYEKEHGMPLCETLLTYYQQHFSIKETADKLFIHYNTLKYRLSIIEKIYGDGFFDTQYDYVTILLALYMHSIGVI